MCPRKVLLSAAALTICWARQLPIKVYTTDDGLPRNDIIRIRADSRGWLWFCTIEGLARFDGHRFTTYTEADGLPDSGAHDLVVTRAGTYWVATPHGLARFQPQPGAVRFWLHPDSARLRWVDVLLQDRAGALWIGSRTGLYRLGNPDAAVPGALEFIDALAGAEIRDLAEGPDGSIWVATVMGAYQRLPGGAVEHYGRADGLSSDLAISVLVDRRGLVWVGTQSGLCRLSPSEGTRHRVTRRFTTDDGLAGMNIWALYESRDGHIWVGAVGGVSELIGTGGDSLEIRAFRAADGFSDDIVISITEDSANHIWLGTGERGAMTVLAGGVNTYTQSDGLRSASVFGLFEDLQGNLHAINGRQHAVSRFDGRSFTSVEPRYGAPIVNQGFRRGQVALQDRQGQWWFATNRGLFRFPSGSRIEDLANVAPANVYSRGDGLPRPIHRIFEDSKGGIWIAGQLPPSLSRWEPRTNALHNFPGVSEFDQVQITGFAESARGDVWMSSYGGLVRYHDGQFEFFGNSRGIPRSRIQCLLIDRAGRIWFGSRRDGLGRIDSPESPDFRVHMHSVKQGLSSHEVNCLVEDQFGRIYAGTPLGLDRVDPDSGAIRHYGQADGLPRGVVRVAFRDLSGRLWFGGPAGLSEFLPRRDERMTPPRVLITGVRVRGNPLPISELGETVISRFTVQPSDNQVEVGFTGLGTGSGESLRYQYRLGVNEPWSAGGPAQTVNYAKLSPGTYQFAVRSVLADGSASDPATVDFVVLAPVWQRWWFLAILAVLGAVAAYALHRWRLARVVELERVRTRIATDLHDDIGSGLSQIAILTEVVRRKGEAGARAVPEALSEIAGTARELVDSMSDIVWAIDPEHDRIGDLTHRMRRFAEDLCGAAGIALTFRAPDSGKSVVVGALVRRQVYLVLKESLNNAVRHSGCNEALVEFRLEGGDLRLTVADNGRGFDPDAASANGGHGVKSIRERARRLGGSVEWKSLPGGTAVELRAPLGRRGGRVSGPHEHAMRRAGAGR